MCLNTMHIACGDAHTHVCMYRQGSRTIHLISNLISPHLYGTWAHHVILYRFHKLRALELTEQRPEVG